MSFLSDPLGTIPAADVEYPPKSRLFDAVIALGSVLSGANIRYGVFGGCALNALGSHLKSEDVDCMVSAGREKTIHVIINQGGASGFICADPSKQLKNDSEHIEVGWSEKSDRTDLVRIKLYPIGDDAKPFDPNTIPAPSHAQLKLQNIFLLSLTISGEPKGKGTALFLPPPNLLKSKVQAAAKREDLQDLHDIIFIMENFADELMEKGVGDSFDLYDVGRATRHWPILVMLLKGMGIDVKRAQGLVDGEKVLGTAGKGVVEGLLG